MNAQANNNLSGRLVSLDAYRGFIMLAMVSSSLGTGKLKGDPDWGWLAYQLDHLAWAGCTFWDLIQPSFMFMVGVSMPFAFAKRVERGESWWRQFGHVVKRCLLLCFIGIVMDSYASTEKTKPVIQFIRVLQQIAIGYFIAFLFLHLGWKGQLAGIILLLGGHTLAFWLDGHAQAWDELYKDQNIGRKIDRWMRQPFEEMRYANILPLSTGFYVTFNAISSAATILIGVMIGELLRRPISSGKKAVSLLLAGGALYGLGTLLVHPDLSKDVWLAPVKRIWTASFALQAAGWTCWMMLVFYLVIDVIGFRGWAFPFVVVGVNSIFIYFCSGVLMGTITELIKPFVSMPLRTLFTSDWLRTVFSFVPLRSYDLGEPVVMACLKTFALWLLCLFLYRHRIFFKV